MNFNGKYSFIRTGSGTALVGIVLLVAGYLSIPSRYDAAYTPDPHYWADTLNFLGAAVLFVGLVIVIVGLLMERPPLPGP